MATEGYALKLAHELRDWEAFGTLPGSDKLRLYVDRGQPSNIDDCDLAFLWVAWAQTTIAIDDADERRGQGELILAELTDELLDRAALGDSPASDWAEVRLDPDAFERDNGCFMLGDDQTLVCLASVRVGSESTRTLYGSMSVDGATAVELSLTAGGTCVITRSLTGRPGQTAAFARLLG